MTAFEEIKKKYSKEDLRLIIMVIRMNPNYSEAYNNRGKATMDLVEAGKVLEFYQDVLANYDLGGN